MFLIKHIEVPGSEEMVRGAGELPLHQPGTGRRCRRRVWDDPALARALWEQVRPRFEEPVEDEFGLRWRPCGVNPRFRLIAYDPGDHFGWHEDARLPLSPTCHSTHSLTIYLTTSAPEDGGCTELRGREDVRPEAGTALVLDVARGHPVHRGGTVFRGRKVILRTDILAELEGEAPDWWRDLVALRERADAADEAGEFSDYLWTEIMNVEHAHRKF